jgi:hypothetical protein
MLRRCWRDRQRSQGEFVDLLIDQLLAEHNHHSLLGQLDTVEVTNARISLRDVPTGLTWVAPSAQARLKRDARGRDHGHSPLHQRDDARADRRAIVGHLFARPQPPLHRGRARRYEALDAGDLSPDTVILRGLDIALSGNLRIEATGGGEIKTVVMDVTAGAGTIMLPGILPASHKVRSVNALAHIDAASHTARIDHIEVDLGAARISITGTGLRTEQGQTFSGRAELKGVPVDKVGDYWPLDFAPGGRAWALANLSGGTLDVAAEFALSTPGNDLAQLSVDRNVAFSTIAA